MPRTKHRKNNGSAAGSSHNRQFTEAELEGSRPPSWARGKMIGLWHRHKNLKKKQKPNDEQAKELACFPVEIPQEKISEVQEILKRIGMPAPRGVQSINSSNFQERYKHVEDSAFKARFLKSVKGNIQHRMSTPSRCALRQEPALDDRYIQEEKSKMSHYDVKERLEWRQKLPSWKKRYELLDALDKHSVILVTGETGCGKTTQVPQFILEEAILAGRGSQTFIICTQPRRISAITVAERVAWERGERLGGSVGYQIRLEKALPRSTASILYCTTGVLLQYMHTDPLLTKVSAVIVDEIHERNTISDFVITLLKDIAPSRPDLKIILMSATLNAERFSKYFNNCITVHIPGFTYPVSEYYLEDILETIPFSFPLPSGAKHRKSLKEDFTSQDSMFLNAFYRDLEKSKNYSKKTIENLRNPDSNEINCNLISSLLQHICSKMKPGAILVFLPGWDKISALNKTLIECGKFPKYKYRILPLHSLMPSANQKQVFERPPQGVRKIILATNIAETSITIDDVVYVIDSGKIKIKNFDVDGNVSTLKEEWVSLANSKQRRGRAGRVQSGTCFHLFSKGREMLLEKDMLPEILRTRLEEVILQGKILQVGKIGPFLQKVMDPPADRAVEISVELLKAMNALDEDENLTPLGFHLAELPIDPQAGKMLLFASIFGVLDPVCSIAAALSYKDPFVIPLGQEREVDRMRKSYDADHKSDHLILSKVIAQYEDAKAMQISEEFVKSNFLSKSILEQLRDMKKQFARLLNDMKYIPSSLVTSDQNNVNSKNISLVRAVVCAGLFPNVAVVKKSSHRGKRVNNLVFTTDQQKVEFHPKSIFATTDTFESRFMVYFEKLKNHTTFLYDCTMVYPLALIFFCHNLKVQNNDNHSLIKAGENIVFYCSNEIADVIVELRAWLDWLLEYKMCHPGISDWNANSTETSILKAIAQLVASEEAVYTQTDCFSRGSDDDVPYLENL